MKVSLLTLSSFMLTILLPQQSAALKCGIKGITEPCIGDTDIRYNPDVSYDIKEQDNFWARYEGLYIGDQSSILAYGKPNDEIYLPGVPRELGSWNHCGIKSFTVSKL